MVTELEQWRDLAAPGNREAGAKKLEVWEAAKLAVAVRTGSIVPLRPAQDGARSVSAL